MAPVTLSTVLVLLPVLISMASPPVLARTLEEEESFEEALSASASFSPLTTCCTRDQKMKTIGISDTTGEQIEVDVGRCRRRCGGKRQLKKHDVQRLMLENPDVDPRLLFLLHSTPRGEPSCPGEEVCSPSAWRVERLATTEGTVSVTVTESCNCHARPHSCSRQPRPVTLHKGTPLQTTLDLGDCQGHCPHELGCRATKSRTVAVEGPNGSECVTVVDECGCEDACYRASLLQHVYNYTSPDAPQAQVIDVGTCIGECDIVPEDQCVTRVSSGGCLLSLVRRNSRCSPIGLDQVSVTQEDGTTRTLYTVTRCGCL
ncbi:uncharacterized protein LOC123505803 [Portunus trituberculatus]|uniref:uncharacterized protein LOC123505803 n=1 Tax=Portunus trituberculatus TaxID=210409 RepID=UPI001E1CE1B3|nr:uncharacterized protein LOC123505803 [Portunus trituberculatus]